MAITKIQSESLNLADDFAFTGTITGAGGVNTPYFYAYGFTGNQSISDQTVTPITNWNTPTKSGSESFSSGIWTPAETGKYLIGASVSIGNVGDGKRTNVYVVYNNGGGDTTLWVQGITHGGVGDSKPMGSVIVPITSASGTIKVSVWQDGGTKNAENGQFWGHKIIE